ncbi:hypothetical protein IX51_06815 [uncultured archaeon]|nr:hypothetical protein IX51_06815 [uncultured archaeon]
MENNENMKKKMETPVKEPTTPKPEEKYFEEEEEYEEAKEPVDDPYIEDAGTTKGGPYFAFFAALIVMSLMLAVWLFSALYFGRWNLI